ncbi:MAG: glycosyltransferase family 4 protein [Candidatus Helarchaeota archaeon]
MHNFAMKILHYTIGFHYPLRGGVETRIFNVAKMLSDFKHVVIAKAGQINRPIPLTNLQVIFTHVKHYTGLSKYRNYIRDLPNITTEFNENVLKIINQQKAEILIIYGNDDLAMYLPLFLSNSKYKILYLQTFLIKCPDEALRKADYIITTTQYAIDAYKRNHNNIYNEIKNKLYIIPGTYNPKIFNIKNRKPFDGTKFLFTGRISPIKHIKELLLCFNQFKHHAKKYHLTLIGGSFSPSYMNEVKEIYRKDPEYIKFIDFMSLKELASYYKSHDILIMPSKRETFGHSILEALACGMMVAMITKETIWSNYVISEYSGNTPKERICKLIKRLMTDEIKYINNAQNVQQYKLEEVQKLWLLFLKSLKLL